MHVVVAISESGKQLLYPKLSELILGAIAFAILFTFMSKWVFPRINVGIEGVGGRGREGEPDPRIRPGPVRGGRRRGRARTGRGRAVPFRAGRGEAAEASRGADRSRPPRRPQEGRHRGAARREVQPPHRRAAEL